MIDGEKYEAAVEAFENTKVADLTVAQFRRVIQEELTRQAKPEPMNSAKSQMLAWHPMLP